MVDRINKHVIQRAEVVFMTTNGSIPNRCVMTSRKSFAIGEQLKKQARSGVINTPK